MVYGELLGTASPCSGNQGRPEQAAEVHGGVCLALIRPQVSVLGLLLH